jgi:RNA polymerase sigma-70 factor (ECF subfamily)
MLEEHELEHVRAYRTGVAGPDDAVVAAARLKLMQAIGEESGPARRESKPRPTRERLRRLQRRRRFVLAGGLATVGVGLAGALGLSTAATPVSALAAQMNRLAIVAAGQSWSGIPGPGQYLYTESEAVYDIDTYAQGKTCVIAALHHRQIWIATDGSGALNDNESHFQFSSPADQAECAAMGVTDPSAPTVVGTNSGGSRFPAGGLSFPTNDWKSLSSDPATLLTQIHERDGGPETPAELFTNVADFMRESDVPPVIRAALYKATALIPGVKLLGPTATHDGQSGLGVAFYADGQPTHALIFDQSTGRLLGELYFGSSGEVVNWVDYLQQQIVDSVPNYPMASSQANPSGTDTAGDTTSTPAQTTTAATSTQTTTSAPTAPAQATTSTPTSSPGS